MENNVSQQDIIMKVSCILQCVFKKIITIIIVFIVCGIVFDTYKTINYVPTYSSALTATLGGSENTFQNLSKIQNYVSTFKYVLNSETSKDYIKQKMGVNSLNLTFNVTTSTANIVTITATSPSKQETYFGLEYIINWYNSSRSRYRFPYKVTILEKNSFSDLAMNPNNHRRNFIKGGLAGAAVVFVILALLAYFKETIMSASDVKKYLKVRLYSKIPKVTKKRGWKIWKRNKEALLMSSYKTPFEYKEAINKLAFKVLDSAQAHHYQAIMVTSTSENEGKSSIAVNLAIALAAGDKKVALIDTDIRKPSLDKIFELDQSVSLNSFLKDESKWTDNLRYNKKENVFIITCTQDLEHAEELIDSSHMDKMITEAKKVFDYVIIDASPAAMTYEPVVINQYVDATLFVVKQNEAPRSLINETISKLNNVKNNVIGIIYNASIKSFTQVNKIYGNRYGYGQYGRKRRERS